VSPGDPNLAKVELIVRALGDLRKYQDETLADRVATVAARLQQIASLDRP
jgi:hypothetical protein